MPVAARLPDTMLCMEITQPGPPEVMQPCRRSVPKVQAGEVLGIRVLDHIVVGDGACVSFAERGLL